MLLFAGDTLRVAEEDAVLLLFGGDALMVAKEDALLLLFGGDTLIASAPLWFAEGTFLAAAARWSFS